MDLFKDKTDRTRKLYLSNLRRLNDGKDVASLNFLKKTGDILKQIEAVPNPNTRRSYYIAVVSVLQDVKGFKKYYTVYHEKMMEMNKTLNEKPHKSEATKEKVAIPMETLLARQKELSAKVDEFKKKKSLITSELETLNDCLLVSLYTLLPPRRNRDYMEMVCKPVDPSNNDVNYYDDKFYFNQYKTNKTYNQQVVEVPKELADLINLSQKFSVFTDGYLLHNATGKMSSSEMSKAISKAFGFKIGSSAIRNIYLSHKHGGSKTQLEQDVKDMGTSIDTALHTYIS